MVAAENVVILLVGIIWTTFFSLPFIGLRISTTRRALFENISYQYLRFTLIFTTGAFFFLVGEDNWKNILNLLLEGHMWVLCLAFPVILWIVAVYFFYKIWKDLLYGLRGEE